MQLKAVVRSLSFSHLKKPTSYSCISPSAISNCYGYCCQVTEMMEAVNIAYGLSRYFPKKSDSVY